MNLLKIRKIDSMIFNDYIEAVEDVEYSFFLLVLMQEER